MAAEDHRISLPEALEMVRRGRQAPPKLVNGWLIGAGIIREILDQPGAVSLRAYLAAKEDGEATLVFVGVDATGKDMTEGTIAEWAQPCPPVCDPSSALNPL